MFISGGQLADLLAHRLIILTILSASAWQIHWHYIDHANMACMYMYMRMVKYVTNK